MIAAYNIPIQQFEEVLAELTEAAYDVALSVQEGVRNADKPRANFLETKLQLWASLRSVLQQARERGELS